LVILISKKYKEREQKTITQTIKEKNLIKTISLEIIGILEEKTLIILIRIQAIVIILVPPRKTLLVNKFYFVNSNINFWTASLKVIFGFL
jgi:hypothetical protein